MIIEMTPNMQTDGKPKTVLIIILRNSLADYCHFHAQHTPVVTDFISSISADAICRVIFIVTLVDSDSV